jgi:Secretion system C-terminal sorting domain
MKKIYSLGLLLSFSLSFGQLTDDFTGTGLATANGWATHSGTAGQLSLTTGTLTYAGITTTGNKIAFVSGNTEDINKSMATAITGTSYYSTVINLPNTTGLAANTATGEYSISFGSGPSTATSAGSLVGRIYFRLGSVANTFNVGVLNGSGGTAAPSFVATDYPINTPIFVVVKWVQSTNTASMFVNPVIGTAEPVATATNVTGTTAAPAQTANIALRQAATTGNVEFDAIRAADNWAFVTAAVLSTKLQNSIAGLSIYPNPAKNILNITSDSFETKTVAIYSVLGKVVLSEKVTNAPINIANLSSGVYVVKVSEGDKTASRKLVIE